MLLVLLYLTKCVLELGLVFGRIIIYIMELQLRCVAIFLHWVCISNHIHVYVMCWGEFVVLVSDCLFMRKEDRVSEVGDVVRVTM